jgi:Mitochondrial 39-S ribosomal protein L47 (MRP-L47)
VAVSSRASGASPPLGPAPLRREFASKRSTFGSLRHLAREEDGIPGEGPGPAASRAGLEQFFEISEPGGRRYGKPVAVGRSWSASLLRQKSFEDLHKLWHVLLKERNMLLSERNLAKYRLALNGNDEEEKKYFINVAKRQKSVKKSMARIKHVLRERDFLEQFKKVNPDWEDDLRLENERFDAKTERRRSTWKRTRAANEARRSGGGAAEDLDEDDAQEALGAEAIEEIEVVEEIETARA